MQSKFYIKVIICLMGLSCYGQKFTKSGADSLYSLALEYDKINVDSSDLYFKKALEIYKNEGNLKSQAACYVDLSQNATNKGDYKIAGEFDLKAIELLEKLGDSTNLVTVYSNFAINLNQLAMAKEALEYSHLALNMVRQINRKDKLILVYSNLADVYTQNHLQDSAIYYLTEACSIAKGIKNNELLQTSIANLGNAFYNKGEETGNKIFYRKALACANESIDKKFEISDSSDWAFSKGLIGACEMALENYRNAETAYLDAEHFFINKDVFQLNTIYREMISLYIKWNKNNDALKYFYKYEETAKKITSDENLNATAEMRTKYETQKKEQQNLFLNQQNKLTNENLAQQKLITYLVIAGLLIAIIFGFIAYKNYKQKEKANMLISLQKKQVEDQKHLIEEKQKEIIDSISYAKRLQEAILPTEKRVKDYLPDSFILYKPKDIVAGDFYWMEIVDNLVLIAAADCTGHGVPGALVSVVCSGALNRTVLEFGLINPAEILDKTRELVLETFARSDNEVKDGMDISLAAINLKTNEVIWSGANNPLWYFGNGTLNEITAHKQPIGKSDKHVPFPAHNVKLSKGDIIYLFTDGYADQFGGEKGKKFKYKQLANLLEKIYNSETSMQKQVLNEKFESWKGDLEQVDDVCIIGIRI